MTPNSAGVSPETAPSPVTADDPIAPPSSGAAAAAETAAEPTSRIAHVPITFFAATMGLAGLTLAWRRAGATLDTPAWIGDALFWLSLAAYAAALAGYAAKAALHPAGVRADLHHPIRLAFLPAPGIALVLIAAGGQELAPTFAGTLWWIGALVQLALTLTVLASWLSRPTFTQAHVTPAWFIPAVGLVAAPLAGARFAPEEVNWFYFGSGVVFWLAFLPLILGRLFLHEQPVPAKLLPTLAILVAPPAVVMLSLLRLEPHTADSPLPQALYGVAVFFLLLLATQLPRLAKVPFAMSWWGYSFPLAAFSAATTSTAARIGGGFDIAAWAALALVTAVIAGLAVKTALEMRAGRICVPE